jgi:Tol biopolymer transport system component
VFASNREGDRRWRIYRVWAWAEGTLPETSLGFGRSPAWSPDGQRIAYQGCDEQGNRCGLWTMAPDGSSRQPLTNDPSDTAPAWSPDGKRLAFMSYERTGRWDLYILRVATGRVTPLVMGAGNAGLPVWSPDGQQIAFLSDHSGSWAIYIVPATGGAIQKLADLPGTTDDWLLERLSWGR